MFGSIIQDMVIDMNEARLNTVGQLAAFLEGTSDVDFRSQGNDAERYGFIGSVVARFAYRRLRRADKGVVMRYLGRTTGYSRQQLTRLIGRCLKGQKLSKRYRRPDHGFPRKYTAADVTLLAQTDALHQTLSGPATRRLMQRAFSVYGDARYARLATLSVGHLYNLRRRAGYQATRLHWTKREQCSWISQPSRRQPEINPVLGYNRMVNPVRSPGGPTRATTDGATAAGS